MLKLLTKISNDIRYICFSGQERFVLNKISRLWCLHKWQLVAMVPGIGGKCVRVKQCSKCGKTTWSVL